MELDARGVISLSPQLNTRGTIISITNSSPFIIQNTFHCENDIGYVIAMDVTDGTNEFRFVNVNNMVCSALFLQRALYTVHCTNIMHSRKPSFVITPAVFS